MAVNHEELQPRIRALSAAGDLPDEGPQVHEVSERLGGFRSKHRPTCLICGELDAVLAYFWIGGRVAYLHAPRVMRSGSKSGRRSEPPRWATR